jgi:hypothetical protein
VSPVDLRRPFPCPQPLQHLERYACLHVHHHSIYVVVNLRTITQRLNTRWLQIPLWTTASYQLGLDIPASPVWTGPARADTKELKDNKDREKSSSSTQRDANTQINLPDHDLIDVPHSQSQSIEVPLKVNGMPIDEAKDLRASEKVLTSYHPLFQVPVDSSVTIRMDRKGDGYQGARLGVDESDGHVIAGGITTLPIEDSITEEIAVRAEKASPYSLKLVSFILPSSIAVKYSVAPP